MATLFLAWGQDRADYKKLAKSFSGHVNAQVREVALSYSPTFLTSVEYPELFSFQRDSYVSEIAMGGPLRFILRDRALEILAGINGI